MSPFGPAGPAAPVAPVSPRGIVNVNVEEADVPPSTTDALVPSFPVFTDTELMDAKYCTSLPPILYPDPIGIFISPTTSKVYAGSVVPIPTLVEVVSIKRLAVPISTLDL